MCALTVRRPVPEGGIQSQQRAMDTELHKATWSYKTPAQMALHQQEEEVLASIQFHDSLLTLQSRCTLILSVSKCGEPFENIATSNTGRLREVFRLRQVTPSVSSCRAFNSLWLVSYGVSIGYAYSYSCLQVRVYLRCILLRSSTLQF